MKFIVAPASFKGSLSATQAAEEIRQGIVKVLPRATIVSLPVADGGEGTVEAFITALNGKKYTVPVQGPLEDSVLASYGICGDIAIIEMAQAAGLPLVPENKRDPLYTTTFGVGELITQALKHPVNTLIIGIGGSATIDGGCGMMQALGVRFFDKKGNEIKKYITGGRLNDIGGIDLANLNCQFKKMTIKVACDVDSPLLGDYGAARVFGPQKGATPETVAQLEAGLHNISQVIKRDLKQEVAFLKGAGAAGGLGGGLAAFLNADLISGADLILKTIQFEKHLPGTDYIFVGEGSLDSQSFMGKIAGKIVEIAFKRKIPVIALVGGYAHDIEPLFGQGLTAVFSIVPKPVSLKEAMRSGAFFLRAAAEQVARIIAG